MRTTEVEGKDCVLIEPLEDQWELTLKRYYLESTETIFIKLCPMPHVEALVVTDKRLYIMKHGNGMWIVTTWAGNNIGVTVYPLRQITGIDILPPDTDNRHMHRGANLHNGVFVVSAEGVPKVPTIAGDPMTDAIWGNYAVVFNWNFRGQKFEKAAAMTRDLIQKAKRGNASSREDQPPKGSGPVSGRNGDPHGYYKTLGVLPTASEAEIRDAYRRKIQEYHPDLFDHEEHEWIRREAEEETKRINEAWNVLGDAGKRADYDRS